MGRVIEMIDEIVARIVIECEGAGIEFVMSGRECHAIFGDEERGGGVVGKILRERQQSHDAVIVVVPITLIPTSSTLPIDHSVNVPSASSTR